MITSAIDNNNIVNCDDVGDVIFYKTKWMIIPLDDVINFTFKL